MHLCIKANVESYVRTYVSACLKNLVENFLCSYVYVTRHEKTGLMYTKYTYSYYSMYLQDLQNL